MKAILQPFVEIKDQKIALLFSDYLQSLDISTKIDHIPEKESYLVSCQADRIEQVKIEFEQFVKNPHQAKYQQSAWQNSNITQMSNQSPSLIGTLKKDFLARAGTVTLTVFALSWLIYLFSILGFSALIFDYLAFYHQFSLDEILSAPHRIISPAFFHFSWLHIVFNSLWWWQLASDIEKVEGKMTLLLLLMLSAIVANVGQFYTTGNNFGGLSGVVFALLGYIWWLQWLSPKVGLSIQSPIIIFMLVWLFIGFTGLLPFEIANTAHLLGLIVGCAFAILQVLLKKTIN